MSAASTAAAASIMLQEPIPWLVSEGWYRVQSCCWRDVMVTRALLAVMNATSLSRHNVAKDGHLSVRAGPSPVLAPANYSWNAHTWQPRIFCKPVPGNTWQRRGPALAAPDTGYPPLNCYWAFTFYATFICFSISGWPTLNLQSLIFHNKHFAIVITSRSF